MEVGECYTEAVGEIAMTTEPTRLSKERLEKIYNLKLFELDDTYAAGYLWEVKADLTLHIAALEREIKQWQDVAADLTERLMQGGQEIERLGIALASYKTAMPTLAKERDGLLDELEAIENPETEIEP